MAKDIHRISVEQWREVFALLDAALEIPAADRTAWLNTLDRPASLILTLRDLLVRKEAGDYPLQLPQFTGSPDWPESADSDAMAPGHVVGPYRLIGTLGRGGMSSVWIAERTDGSPRRRVALKLPHLGSSRGDLARRMARERDLLGTLEHPGIARLYDAGVCDDGRPFLAMELVEGLPIDAYCEARNTGVDTRVSLVLQVARAVAYAHSRSIIHRDLKPANILVDASGQVHLLDFGIGKLLQPDTGAAAADTQFAGRLFTPDFAAPEQLRGGAVTPACDVFSLGAVMHRLLAGQLPFAARGAQASGDEPATDPRPPSTVAKDPDTRRALRGDLDTIVLKALKHRESERYESMAAFAEDLEHYLRGEPVRARRDSPGYRLRKFARRHRRTVTAVAVTLALALAAGATIYLRQSRQHDALTAAAIDESADAMARRGLPYKASQDEIANQDYLRARSLMLRPTEENLREILRLTQHAVARDPGFAHAYSLLAGANVLALDVGYENPGALPLAEGLARKAIALEPRLGAAYAGLGSIAAHRGQWIEAEAQFKRAMELDDRTGRIHARHAQTVLLSMGRIADATREFRAELRLTPAHARGAMQVAQALAIPAGREAEALRYLDIALSLGWPPEERDVRELRARISRRAGQDADAMAYQVLGLPGAIRELDGPRLVARLYDALRNPTRRAGALQALDEAGATLRAAGTESFESTMFLLQWCALLGDLERAHAAANRWVALAARSGTSGIPHNIGFWLEEMRAFRADRRFVALAKSLGMTEYWRRFEPPDDEARATR